MRILFWGTPEFAAPSLRALLGEGFDVVGVVTQPDKPVGRSRSTVRASPVKQVAIEEGVPVLQPEKPRGEAFIARVRELAPDISVVVAYGHILKREVIDLPPRGTINVHASLLPELRGAAPIQAAIRDGIDYTGVSVMRLVERLDAGPVILQLGTTVAADETYGELALRLAELGAAALIESLALIEMGKAAEVPQAEAQATYASKIDRDATRIDWTREARVVSRVIRAYDPRPGAFTTLGAADVKVYGARVSDAVAPAAPGVLTAIDADGLLVACGTGAVRIAQVQPAGRKRLAPDEWLRGRGVAVGQRFV